MSVLGRTVSGKAVAALVAVMIVMALLPVLSRTRADREVVLVVRGMAFYLEGAPGRPNPEIVLTRGERVRIVLANNERGMTHDFAVPALGAATDLVHWNQRDEVVLTAPATPGAYDYVCTPHSLMMRGTIRVE